ncbi:MAG: hypothetical protein IPM21_02235 [Acidobacteria bacterium]|nr:hypothetical protein [Acidobacteriota bacterium]
MITTVGRMLRLDEAFDEFYEFASSDPRPCLDRGSWGRAGASVGDRVRRPDKNALHDELFVVADP